MYWPPLALGPEELHRLMHSNSKWAREHVFVEHCVLPTFQNQTVIPVYAMCIDWWTRTSTDPVIFSGSSETDQSHRIKGEWVSVTFPQRLILSSLSWPNTILQPYQTADILATDPVNILTQSGSHPLLNLSSSFQRALRRVKWVIPHAVHLTHQADTRTNSHL